MAENFDWMDVLLGTAGAAVGTLNTPPGGQVAVHQQILDPDLIKSLGTGLAGGLSAEFTGGPKLAPRAVRQAALGPGRSATDAQLEASYEAINENLNQAGFQPAPSALGAHLRQDARNTTMGANAGAAANWDVADYLRADQNRWRAAGELSSLLQGAATYTKEQESPSDLDNFLSGLLNGVLGADQFEDWLRDLFGGSGTPGTGGAPGTGGTGGTPVPPGGDGEADDGTDDPLANPDDPSTYVGNDDPSILDSIGGALAGGGGIAIGLGLGGLLAWMFTRDKGGPGVDQAAAVLSTAPAPPEIPAGAPPEAVAAAEAAYDATLTPEQLAAKETILQGMSVALNEYFPGIVVGQTTGVGPGGQPIVASFFDFTNVDLARVPNNAEVASLLQVTPGLADALGAAYQRLLDANPLPSPFSGDPSTSGWDQTLTPEQYQQWVAATFAGYSAPPRFTSGGDGQDYDPEAYMGGPVTIAIAPDGGTYEIRQGPIESGY